jgi:formylglycine-generating enzyme required for sulfatase activity
VEITKPFYIGIHEVTIGQTLMWLNSPGVIVQANWINFNDADCPVRRVGLRYEVNSTTKFSTSEQQPMVSISQYGAIAFCAWCSRQDPKHRYRLPWEAEWEYAARAGSRTDFPWGDSCNGTEANVDGNLSVGTLEKGPYLQVTRTVGSYPPNAWGLCDTVGNVYEWCGDWYNENFYISGPRQDPTGPPSGSRVLCRSGSWLNSPKYARSGYRYNYDPAYTYCTIGFRVVAE